MMRKLALTMFAMSLTLAGCGSSSTSKKADAATDAQAAVDVSKDVVAVLDGTPAKLDTSTLDVQAADVVADAPAQTDVSGDGVVTSPDTAPRDTATADSKQSDTRIQNDTRLADTAVVVKLDAAADAPATDTAPVNGDALDETD